MNIETASADDLYRVLLHIQDQLTGLLAEDRLTLERDAEQDYGTARRAVGQAVEHLDAARQILSRLETSPATGD